MTRAIPSREFFVRQAVLNAAEELFPVSAQRGQIAKELAQYLTWPDPSQSMLFRAVPKHYAALCRQYTPPRAAIASGYADALRAGQRRFP